MTTDADSHQSCYCDLWEKDPEFLEGQGVPPGYCGICSHCGAPGHTRHYPGPVPVTSAWCDECYAHLPSVPLVTQLFYVIVALVIVGLVLVFLI